MPIMTLVDRIVIVESHIQTIKRIMKRGEGLEGLPEFWKAIATVASEAVELSEPAEPLRVNDDKLPPT